jgi:hypothetical protein
MYVLRGVTKEDIVSIVASFRKKDVVPAENL